MAGGELDFIGCFFYDFEYLTPLDRIYLGGDVLVLAGVCVYVCVCVHVFFL